MIYEKERVYLPDGRFVSLYRVSGKGVDRIKVIASCPASWKMT